MSGTTDDAALLALNKALGEAFPDDPLNALRAHAAVEPLVRELFTRPAQVGAWRMGTSGAFRFVGFNADGEVLADYFDPAGVSTLQRAEWDALPPLGTPQPPPEAVPLRSLSNASIAEGWRARAEALDNDLENDLTGQRAWQLRDCANELATPPSGQGVGEDAWELIGYECQHDETGRTTFVDSQQMEWGWEKTNERWTVVGPCYRPRKGARPASAVSEVAVVPAKALSDLYRAYVRLLESGKDRIESLGGDCDSVQRMEESDFDLRKASIALSAAGVGTQA